MDGLLFYNNSAFQCHTDLFSALPFLHGVHSQTLLRIACPDGRTLQGAFHPREPLRALLAWLAALLTPHAAASAVLLLPPSTRIEAGTSGGRSAEQEALLDKTFAAAGLVPAARMTLKCTTGGANSLTHSISLARFCFHLPLCYMNSLYSRILNLDIWSFFSCFPLLWFLFGSRRRRRRIPRLCSALLFAQRRHARRRSRADARGRECRRDSKQSAARDCANPAQRQWRRRKRRDGRREVGHGRRD